MNNDFKDIFDDNELIEIDEKDLEIRYQWNNEEYENDDYPGDVFQEMANLNPRKAGLGVQIWAEHGGISRNKSDVLPRVKISIRNIVISVSIESGPKILAGGDNSKIKHSELNALKKGIEYVGRNWDIFLNHYMDTDFAFDDEALFSTLRSRGEYR